MDDIHAKLDTIIANQAEILSRLPKKRKLAERKAEWSAEFAAWWKAYPTNRKADVDKCWARWQLKKLDAVAGAVMARLRFDKASHDWTKEGGQYVPGSYKWLCGAKWDVALADVPVEGEFQHRNPTQAELAALADLPPVKSFDEMMRG